jgi:hypothetical protein
MSPTKINESATISMMSGISHSKVLVYLSGCISCSGRLVKHIFAPLLGIKN